MSKSLLCTGHVKRFSGQCNSMYETFQWSLCRNEYGFSLAPLRFVQDRFAILGHQLQRHLATRRVLMDAKLKEIMQILPHGMNSDDERRVSNCPFFGFVEDNKKHGGGRRASETRKVNGCCYTHDTALYSAVRSITRARATA
jgi:hypothetical protein